MTSASAERDIRLYTDRSLVARHHNDPDVRREAALGVIRICARMNWYIKLIEIVLDEAFPADVRCEAIRRAAPLCRDINEFIKLLSSKELDERVALAGGKALVDFLKKKERANELFGMSFDERLPKTVRFEAQQAFSEFERQDKRMDKLDAFYNAGIGAIYEAAKDRLQSEGQPDNQHIREALVFWGTPKYCVQEGKYARLIGMSKDPTKSKETRKWAETQIEPAADKAIEIFKAKGWMKRLRDMMDDSRLPQTSRDKARDALLELELPEVNRLFEDKAYVRLIRKEKDPSTSDPMKLELARRLRDCAHEVAPKLIKPGKKRH